MGRIWIFACGLLACGAVETAHAQWSVENLSAPRADLTATFTGGEAIFAGGWDYTPAFYSDRVDIYELGTGTWSTASLSQARSHLASASLPGVAFFAGGEPASDRIDVYDQATGSWSIATLSAPRARLAGVAVSGLVLFAGGDASAVVDIFDSSSGAWSTASLSAPRSRLAAASIGTKAFFAGGDSTGNGTPSAVVDIFDASTGIWTTASLSEARFDIAAVTIGSKVLFSGGTRVAPVTPTSTIDVYDDIAGVWSTMDLPSGRTLHAGAATPYHAIFAFGTNGAHPHHGGGYHTADVWDPVTGTWTLEIPGGVRRASAAATAGCSAVFIAGGVAAPVPAGLTTVNIYRDLDDCNTNGVPDCEDIALGTSTDCDLNGVPDDCQIALDPRLDQNQNGIFDLCECQTTSFCTPAPHSAGGPAELSWWGSPSISTNSFHLRVTGGRPNAPGLFFYATQQRSPLPYGDGFLCLASPMYRVLPMASTDSAGSAEHHLDFQLPPAGSGPGAIDLFTTWNVQYWFRDPQGGAAGFNFSDGLQVTFCP